VLAQRLVYEQLRLTRFVADAAATYGGQWVAIRPEKVIDTNSKSTRLERRYRDRSDVSIRKLPELNTWAAVEAERIIDSDRDITTLMSRPKDPDLDATYMYIPAVQIDATQILIV
jgi:hypothetical protein